MTAPSRYPWKLTRSRLARPLLALVVVVVGMVLLWQAGILLPDNSAQTTSPGGTAVTLQPADVSVETPDRVGLDVGPHEGDLAPNFAFSDFDGGRQQLTDYRGRAVLVNFWATWCVPCRAELPSLDQTQQRYGNQLAILAVDDGDPLGPAQDFIRQLGVQLTAFGYDPKGDVAQLYALQGLPTSYFIDADGVVRRIVPGQLTPTLLQAGIDAALAGASTP